MSEGIRPTSGTSSPAWLKAAPRALVEGSEIINALSIPVIEKSCEQTDGVLIQLTKKEIGLAQRFDGTERKVEIGAHRRPQGKPAPAEIARKNTIAHPNFQRSMKDTIGKLRQE